MINHIQKIYRRVQALITTGTLMNSDYSTSVPNIQMQKSTGELHSHSLVQHYGFASAPLNGSQLVNLSVEGNHSKGLILGTADNRYRPKTMKAGEVQIHDNAGNYVYLQNGTIVGINAKTEVDVKIGGMAAIQVTSSAITFSINGNKVFTINNMGTQTMGTQTATGDITGNGTSLHTHIHGGVSSGSSNTAPPV